MMDDAQTHQLPTEPLTRERIALAMGAADWAACSPSSPCSARASAATSAWSSLAASRANSRRVRIDLGRFWDTQAETAALGESRWRTLASTTAREVARLLLELRGSALVRKLDEPGRRRLQTLLPVLLADVAQQQRAAAGAAPRARDHRGDRAALGVLRAAARERRGARAPGGAVPRTGIFSPRQIAAHPLLLDELIDERLLSQLPERADLRARS